MSKQLSRRDMLKLSGGLAAGSLLAGYATAAASTTHESVPVGNQAQQASGYAYYACPWCVKGFDTLAALKDHIYTAHLWNNTNAPARKPIPFGITIGNFVDEAGLRKRVDEMVKRGWRCDFEANFNVPNTYLKELANQGFEFEIDFGGIEKTTSLKEATQFVGDLKKKMEDATGKPVLNGRRAGSVEDPFTYDVLDALGMKIYHLAQINMVFPYQAVNPYRQPGHNFVIMPRPALKFWNQGGDVPTPAPAVDAGEYF